MPVMNVTLLLGVRRDCTIACHQNKGGKGEETTLIPRSYDTIHDKGKRGGRERKIKIHHHDVLALVRPHRACHRLGQSRGATRQGRVRLRGVLVE